VQLELPASLSSGCITTHTNVIPYKYLWYDRASIKVYVLFSNGFGETKKWDIIGSSFTTSEPVQLLSQY
jgi:hypothetical protein